MYIRSNELSQRQILLILCFNEMAGEFMHGCSLKLINNQFIAKAAALTELLFSQKWEKDHNFPGLNPFRVTLYIMLTWYLFPLDPESHKGLKSLPGCLVLPPSLIYKNHLELPVCPKGSQLSSCAQLGPPISTTPAPLAYFVGP